MRGLSREQLENAYYKTLYSSLAQDVIAGNPALKNAAGPLMEMEARELEEKKITLRSLCRKEVYEKLCSRTDMTEMSTRDGEAVLFTKLLSNPKVTARLLMDKAHNMATTICPCVITDPNTLAENMPYTPEEFDLVIFDESSQLTTPRAIGAMSRGKNVLLVGDPMQMPPTRYFQRSSDVDIEEADLESVLDEVIALNVPKTSLNFHYRSKHEDLIAFCNSRFYDGKLVTFPAVSDAVSHVKLNYVEGKFDHTKQNTNREEAEAVIEELRRRAADTSYSTQSVGIITFNVHQQGLIERMLDEARRTDQKLDQWLSTNPEQLFIKNLENVQGDERDLILISVGYGPDETGKVKLHMGPLNRQGGYRRLNVALSRAREEMLVFSSLKPEDITAGSSTSEGVKALHDFLCFASDGYMPNHDKQAVPEESAVADAISRYLEEAGYKTVKNVGSSRLRVDVAVLDPENPERYRLGIMLDRDASMEKEPLIQNMRDSGWNICRIWSVDYLADREGCLRAMMNMIN